MPRKRQLPDGIYERGGTYYSRFRSNGRQVRKRLSTDFKAACEMLRDLRSRADKQSFGLVDNDFNYDDLKAEFVRWAKQSVRNPQDYETDLRHIEAFRKVGSIRQVDHAYAIAFRQWRLSQSVGAYAKKPWKSRNSRCVSPRTVNRELGTLQNMLNKGVDWGRLGSNPLAGLKPLAQGDARKQRRSFSAEEVVAILNASPDYLKPVLRLFTVAAIRHQELVKLLFSDIDFDRRSITIRASVAKSKKIREISIDDGTLTMLAKLRDEAKHRKPVEGNSEAFSRDHVFVTRDNTPHRNNLLRAFYRICKRAGIEGAEQGGSVDLHSLRVTSASLMLENGASPKAVQAILGHSTLALTMNIYAKATEKAKREAVACLPFVNSVSAPEGIVPMPAEHTVSTSKKKAAQVVTPVDLRTGT